MSTEKELKRGVFVNLLGMIGQLSGPALLVVVARIYGPDTLGIFMTALALLDIAISFLTSGFRDAALMFVAKHAEGEEEGSQLYQSLANALLWSFGCAVLVIITAYTIAPVYVPRFVEFSDELIPMLQSMVLAIPFFAIARIIFAATQGLKIMKYEAIDATLRSMSLFALALVLWPLTQSSSGLSIAYVGSQLLSFLFALYVFRRRFSSAKLLSALRSFRLHKELLKFALPQNLNMALNHFITQVDVLMLAYFGASAFQVGLYGAAARIVRELRRIRMVYSSVISPHIVVLFKKAQLPELSELYSRTCGWVALIALPSILALAALHPQIFRLLNPLYVGDMRFVFVLLILPYLDCCYGLAGNLVAMTGHSRINLANSMVIGLSNVALNTVLIPSYGMMGAAIASAIASFLMTVLQLSEAQWMLKTPLLLKFIYRQHTAGLIAVLVGGLSYSWLYSDVLVSQLSWTAMMLGSFLLSFLLLGGRLGRSNA